MEYTINQRIKILTAHLGVNQKKFAEGIGITPAALSQIILGGGISGNTLITICKTYNVSMNWLMEGAGEMFLSDEMKGTGTDGQSFPTQTASSKKLKVYDPKDAKIEQLEKEVQWYKSLLGKTMGVEPPPLPSEVPRSKTKGNRVTAVQIPMMLSKHGSKKGLVALSVAPQA